MRQYQKRRRLHMLIAILMSLNIVSVGYATWAITGPSTDTTDGGFVSYPVIKSDEYYELTTAMDFQGYFNSGGKGYFVLTDGNGNLRKDKDTEEEAQTATITLTYTKKKELTSPTITTTIVFGDTEKTKAFFTTATISAIKVQGSENNMLETHNQLTAYQEGVLTFTFIPKADVTTTTVTITLNTEGQAFPTDLGTNQFIFNTTVQGTPN